MPTRAFEAINRVITILETAGANVVDGRTHVSDAIDFVFVGYDGDPEGDWVAANLDQEWAGIGKKSRDDWFDIVCAVVSHYSADSARVDRDRVQAQFTLVETAILADPSLGFPPPCVAAVKPQQLIGGEGQYRLPFVIRVSTRV